jgi:hypothetical protein
MSGSSFAARPRSRCRAATIAIATLASLASMPADTARLVANGYDITAAIGVVRRGLASGDFNDDGRPDLVASLFAETSASSSVSVLEVHGASPEGTWSKSQTLLLDIASRFTTLPLTWERAGADALIVVTDEGEAVEYAGWPLAEIRRFPIANLARAARVGDVDADGSVELVVGHAAGVSAYRLGDGATLWSLPGDAVHDIALGQFDTDAALELVVASTTGQVYDGATRSVQWTYDAGFGRHLAVGRIGVLNAQGFVGAQDWDSLRVFHANPFGSFWGYQAFDIDEVATFDVDGNGRDEIFVGEGQSSHVHVLDSATRQLRMRLFNGGYGIASIVGGDFDRNGEREMVLGNIYVDPTSTGVFRVVDARTGAERYEHRRLGAGVAAVAYGDLDGDGTVERVISRDDTPSMLQVYAGDGDELLWSLSGVGHVLDDPHYAAGRRIFITQLDADPGAEIVVLGGFSYAGRVTIVDAATRTVQRQIGHHTAEPMNWREIRDGALMHYDGDSIPDLVVLSVGAGSPSPGVRLHVFSLVTGALLWESVPMGSSLGEASSLMLMQSDADPALEIVATLPTELRAFDAQTGLLDWTRTLAGPILAAAHDPLRGEIYVSHRGEVQVFDAFTRDLLRNLPQSADVTALRPIGVEVPRLLTLEGEILHLRDALDGSVLGTSRALGPAASIPTQIALWDEASRWKVAVGSKLGVFRLSIQSPQSTFSDGFEP